MNLSFSKIKKELKNYVTLAKKLEADKKAPNVTGFGRRQFFFYR
jgi:hypothetical protein